MVSPKLRGKWMSRQIKATKHMIKYSKEDLKDIISTSKTASQAFLPISAFILDKGEAR